MTTLRPLAAPDLPAWMALRRALWPDADDSGPAKAEMEQELLAQLADPARYGQFIACAGPAPDAAALGFIEISLRQDYVNGTDSSPVAFVEGLYTQPAARRSGLARQLMQAAQAWAIERGCSELASDTPLDNLDSQAAHGALGFEETERVVYFRKRLGPG